MADSGTAEEDEHTALLLREAGQEHLLEGLEADGRARLLSQARRLDAAYNGGLKAYVRNARQLLQASQRGDNPFAGYTPSVPVGERLTYGDERFAHFEAVGSREAQQAAFVLVAGGLGERLGFSGIKLALPSTVVTGWTFIELYCRCISALQSQSSVADGKAPVVIPLVIMTSDDTHPKTVELLEANNFFGLLREQVHLMKQEKVACLVDSEARLSRDPEDRGQIETKPHGHGDVHAMLHSSGLARRFASEGTKWLVFFQDTNGLFWKAMAATLGVSAELGFAMNSVAVPRKPKDAMGGIAKLTHTDGSSLTLNVEYNQLDPLLRSTVSPDGDVADASGCSPFPGNMNALVLAMDAYLPTLERTGGIIAEFVNPKYADSTRTTFKLSTRLECMMQDFPKELPSGTAVGFTMFDQWCSYSPVKNSPAEAQKKFKSGNHPQCATTGEADLFTANCRALRLAGCDVEAPRKALFNGIEVDLEARVVWSPQWAKGFQDVRDHLAPSASVKISQRSTLVLDGDIVLEGLTLDGALVVIAKPGCRVRITRLSVANEGWELEPTVEDDEDEVSRIRGFRVKKLAARELIFHDPGEHVINEGPSL
mmetsp:Transcript_106753/g.284009  ORF Transcript_106753/g.284009 Transcript_106753/m.284009 type:complete len:597 (-) Transcript_106753:71-1861(-)